VSSVDDLAHDAEVEAEILRAVSSMTPRRAVEFLLAVALKIRRSQEPASSPALPGPEDLDSPPSGGVLGTPGRVQIPGATERGMPVDGTPYRVFDFVRRRGSATSSEVKDEFGARSRRERNAVIGALTRLVDRGLLRLDGETYSVACEPDGGSPGGCSI